MNEAIQKLGLLYFFNPIRGIYPSPDKYINNITQFYSITESYFWRIFKFVYII